MSATIEGARVLVTGGAGLVGSHIVDRCLVMGVDRVVVLDDFSRGSRRNLAPAEAASEGRLRVVEGDVRDRRLLETLLPGVDTVFHQAAIRITECAEKPRMALEVLVQGTFEVVEAAAEAGVRRIVAASSASVYGMADEFPTPETQHPYNNDTFYGAAKAFNEGMLASFAATRGLEWNALRYFNVYGPRMDVFGVYTEVLVRWMERIDNGRAPIIFGDGTQTMDFVHVGDIARANLLAAVSPSHGRAFNVASGTETSLLELARCLAEVMGEPMEPELGPERKVNPVRRRLGSTVAAEHQLGFRAEIGLREGLRDLVDWWKGEVAAGGASRQ